MSVYHYEYAYPVPLSANVATVFRALTNADALKSWFAESVDIGSGEGDQFRFWGRHSFATPNREDATQRITKYEPATAIGFTWRLFDQNTEVTWTLSEDEKNSAATKITVSHRFEKLPDFHRARECIDDLWRIHTGSLCFFLNGEEDVFRPDFDDPSPEARCVLEINAPPENVFAVLVTPEHIKKWFPAPDPFVEPRVGGDYGFGFVFESEGEKKSSPPMKILEFVENERLVITWPDWRGDESVPDQSVAWTLEDLGGRTRLTLVHSGFTRTTDISDYPFGWQEFMEQINSVASAL